MPAGYAAPGGCFVVVASADIVTFLSLSKGPQMKKCVVAAMGGAVATLSIAHGSVIVQTQSFGPTPSDSVQSLTFSKYNGPASELLSIEVRFRLDISGGSLQLDNDNNSPASGTATLGGSGLIYSPDVPLIDRFTHPVIALTVASASTLFSLSANDGDAAGVFNVGGDDYTKFSASPASAANQGEISSSFLSAFVGDGTFDISVALSPYIDFGSTNGIHFSATPVDASGNVSIIYNYEKLNLPTPASASLVGLGGIVALRRRR